MISPQLAAARVLAQVLDQHRSLSDVLPEALEQAGNDRALIQELCYGTLRWWPRLEALLARLLRRPMKAKDRDLHALLLVGLYQLGYLRIPAHAAVSETVAAASQLGKPWAKALINGVLRSYQRQGSHLGQEVDGDEAVALAHPPWLLKTLKEAWPDHWRTIASANNERPPMSLRVNRRFQDRAAYLEELARAGLEARPAPHAPEGIILAQPVPVERLPGFEQGRVSVQDSAAQLAAGLLELKPGQRLLDACAAPGGKTGHILETCPQLELLALDRDPARLSRIEQNLQRLGLEAQPVAGDAGRPRDWWDGRPFDRILLDAPCSATGVIRRHPDIKALRRPGDIPSLVTRQARLLQALWPLLGPGGMLVYATCSVLPQENARQMARFLAEQEDAHETAITASWGHQQEAGRQILPNEDGMDGFYYARISKG